MKIKIIKITTDPYMPSYANDPAALRHLEFAKQFFKENKAAFQEYFERTEKQGMDLKKTSNHLFQKIWNLVIKEIVFIIRVEKKVCMIGSKKNPKLTNIRVKTELKPYNKKSIIMDSYDFKKSL